MSVSKRIKNKKSIRDKTVARLRKRKTKRTAPRGGTRY